MAAAVFETFGPCSRQRQSQHPHRPEEGLLQVPKASEAAAPVLSPKYEQALSQLRRVVKWVL